MAGGPQKTDHGGNFIVLPRKLLASPAWRSLSMHARATYLVFCERHNGFNNGEIALGVREVSAALGNQNHRATSRSICELIERGFLVCTSDADHHQAKTRTYRITAIQTGNGKKEGSKATNDYLEWRPGPLQKRKFGGARTATQRPVSVTETATERKFPVAVPATTMTEICGFEADACVAVPATLIGNQSVDHSRSSGSLEIIAPVASRPAGVGPAQSSLPALDELREWTRAVIAKLGYGGAKKLAAAAKVPEPVLSRFRQGKNLPEHHRLALQHACGRALPFNVWKAAA